MPWFPALPVAELDKKPRVFSKPPRQIAIFKVGDRVFAIDNRCPHEGYPLAEGNVSQDCVLTCNWHNWKFRLEDGECILGGDHVRCYETRIENGDLWVNLVDPPAEEVRHQILQGLGKAIQERDSGRICREIARLHFSGIDLLDAVREALKWYHNRIEFGTTHASAATADWLALARTLESEAETLEGRVICLGEAVDHLAYDSLRQPVYPYAQAGATFEPAAFLDAIECEEAGRAEALAARGLTDGLHWADMEGAFAAAAVAHYNDFGHSLIYVQKTGELIAALGPDIEPFVVPPLARGLAYAMREDRLPEFKEYQLALKRLPEPSSGRAPDTRPHIPFPATLRQGFDWLAEHLAVHDVMNVYDALLEALALNLLYFDARYGMAYDRPVSQTVGWLDYTHGLTFSNAARVLSMRHPSLWKPALAQMACFLGRNSPFIDRDLDREAWRVHDREAFLADVRQKLLDHGFRDPIYSAHFLKTTIAVCAELTMASPSCRQALLDGLNRFLNSPIKTKHVRRLARQAIDLVRRDF